MKKWRKSQLQAFIDKYGASEGPALFRSLKIHHRPLDSPRIRDTNGTLVSRTCYELARLAAQAVPKNPLKAPPTNAEHNLDLSWSHKS